MGLARATDFQTYMADSTQFTELPFFSKSAKTPFLTAGGKDCLVTKLSDN